MPQDRDPNKHVMDLDASLEVYEEWKAEEEARETEEVENEVGDYDLQQLVTRELSRVVSQLHHCTSFFEILTKLCRTTLKLPMPLLPTLLSLVLMETRTLSTKKA